MAACPICGSPRDPKDRQCRTCGAAFTAEPNLTAAQPPAPSGVVTVANGQAYPTAKPKREPRGARKAAKAEKRAARHAAEEEEPAPERRGGAWIVLIVVIPMILCCCAIISAQALMRLVSI